MLCLSSSDIEKAASTKEIIGAVEKAMLVYESGNFNMPNRMHIDFKGNTLLLMPCFAGDSFATKLVSVFPDNYKVNKPAIYGTVFLNDGKTGEPLAIMNGGKLTAMRTGAVGGVGIKYLSDKNISAVGLIGAGIQGFHQVLFACSERSIKEVFVYDSFTYKLGEFAEKLSAKLPSVKVSIAKTNKELQEKSELIIVATTSSNPVLVDDKELLKNKTYIAIGSYKLTHRELPDGLFSLIDQCFIDTTHAKDETADIASPLKNRLITDNQVYTIGKLVNGSMKLSDNKTKLFKSVGMALYDLFVANLLYKKAVEKSIGSVIDL